MSWFLTGAACGIVFKILVPMPWADDPVRNAWAWVWRKIAG